MCRPDPFSQSKRVSRLAFQWMTAGTANTMHESQQAAALRELPRFQQQLLAGQRLAGPCGVNYKAVCMVA